MKPFVYVKIGGFCEVKVVAKVLWKLILQKLFLILAGDTIFTDALYLPSLWYTSSYYAFICMIDAFNHKLLPEMDEQLNRFKIYILIIVQYYQDKIILHRINGERVKKGIEKDNNLS